MLLTSCSPIAKKATPAPATTTPTTTQALQDRIAAAESRVTGLESGLNADKANIDSLINRVIMLEGDTGEAADYSSEIADLQAQIDDLVDELDNSVSENDVSSDETSYSEPIRWRFDNPVLYNYANDQVISDAHLITDVRPDDSRVEEEGVYYLDLIITNTDPTTPIVPINLGTCYIKFTMRPYSSSDYALLDESEMYLDTDEIPYLSWGGIPFAEPSWDASYDTREREGQEVTKKVIFESDRCAISSLEGTVKLTLFLELYYAD